jgi:putative ABC transport system permease protein
MSGILSDARYALRTLVRYPGFNLAALLLLALGIGANTFIFGILDGARVQGHAPPAAAIGEIEISGWLLAGLLGCTLLLICANVARLLLVRDAARRRELALRGALGASRLRLVRQLLTESVILALLGGGAGLLLVAAGIYLAEALAPAGPGRLPHLQVNGRVVLYGAALALAAGYVCGLRPALRVTLGSLGEGLRPGGPAAPGAARGRRRPRRWFLAGEVALALVLLASAGLEIKNFYLFTAIDPGFAPRRAVLTASVHLPAAPGAMYAGGDARAALFQRLLGSAARLPGVATAAAISSLPTGSTEDMSFTIDGNTAAAGPATHRARVIQVSPGCFQVLGVPVRRGRPFGADDTGANRGSDRPLPPAIVNQEFVRDYSSDEEPLGRRLVFSSLPGPAAWQIVGVVADVRQDGMESPAPAIVYLPYWQDTPLLLAGGVSMSVLLRAAGDRDAAFLAAPLRQALAAIDPKLALAEPRTAAELFDRMAAGRPRLLLLTLFAGFFVALAAVGIYGAVSGSVAQRSREIAIREAVGANRHAVLKGVVREGLALTARGTALGLGVFMVFGLGLSTSCLPLEGDRLWYGPALGVLASLSMLAVGALASWLPAARAARLDLVAALRDG